MESKLPHVGTTVFTVMSDLAQACDAINLSQGFPDFDPPEALLDAVQGYLRGGFNQYPPMTGVPSLRAAIAATVSDLYGLPVCADTEVTVTSGATEALFCAIAACVQPGDEVIVFDPAYDSYEPAVELQGGRAVHLPLSAPSYRPDWERVKTAITPRTRALVINSPHNPTGAIWAADDLLALEALAVQHGLYVISDEVYEHIVFDGARHESVCRYPELYARSFVISSLGKTYHCTGWKIGYCVAPAALTVEFRKLHQYVTFTSHTPTQLGLADFMASCPEHHLTLGDFYQRKRDLFVSLLEGSRFEIVPSAGTYFQLLNYARITDEPDAALAERWAQEVRIASIPLSPFYEQGQQDPMLRFCFAKDDATLRQAAEVLCKL